MKYFKIILAPKDDHEGTEREYLGHYESTIVLADDDDIGSKVLAEKLAIIADVSKDDTLDDYVDYTKEVSVEDLIEEEENSLKSRIKRDYMALKYDAESMTIRDFNKLSRSIDFDNPETYYETLTVASKMLRLKRYVRKIADLTKLTVKEYDEIAMALYKAHNEEEMQAVLKKYNLKS